MLKKILNKKVLWKVDSLMNGVHVFTNSATEGTEVSVKRCLRTCYVHMTHSQALARKGQHDHDSFYGDGIPAALVLDLQ